MSTQERFRNLLLHMGKTYTAKSDVRTALMMQGLDDIVAKINPHDSDRWRQVQADSKRLLKVWQACEDSTTAPIMAAEILDSIEEFSSGLVEVPALVISETPLAISEVIHHISPMRTNPAPNMVSAPNNQTVFIIHREGAVEEEEEIDEEEEEEEEEEKEEDEEIEEIEDEEEEEEVKEEVVEPEEEVVEPDEEEEEEGMEVEKHTIRGRDYWLDTNTQKLYAIEGEDDVGDEVGIIINGKPVFCVA